MGVTIAYSGQLADTGKHAELRAFLRDHAREMEWRLEPLERVLPSATLGGRPLENVRLAGAVLLPHVASEPLPILWVEETGQLCDLVMRENDSGPVELQAEVLVKTQFAGPEAHVEIIEFLEEFARRFAPGLGVEDETEFAAKRDEAALRAAFDAAWSELLTPLRETGAPPTFAIGGFEIDATQAGKPGDDPFSRLSDEQREIITTLGDQLRASYGGFGLQLGDDASGLEDLDLLMIEIDPMQLPRTGRQGEADAMAHQLGAAFGQAITRQLGGTWKVDEESGLTLTNVGGVGLSVNPFQVAAERLVYGPSYSFHNHFTAYGELVAQLTRLGS